MPALPLLLAASLLLAGCRAAEPRPARLDGPPAWELENPVRPLPAAPLGSGADLATLPWVTPEKVRLGRWLFFDARLSADGSVSCASCHRPEFAFSEPTPVSTGVGGRTGFRKAPPLVNVAFPAEPVWFWDGRATSLVEQSKGPLLDPVEMGNLAEELVARIGAISGYRPYFREAFGDPAVDLDRIAEAVAAYEATLLSGNSRWDRYEAGDHDALDEVELHGREIFFGRGDCSECHSGPNLSDAKFHNLGVGYEPRAEGVAGHGFADPGRYAVTGLPEDIGAFKTPTLRDCSKHAPYMHDGSARDLREAVLHYWRGGIRNPWLSHELEPVPMTRYDLEALVAFLEALDGEGHADVPPRRFPE